MKDRGCFCLAGQLAIVNFVGPIAERGRLWYFAQEIRTSKPPADCQSSLRNHVNAGLHTRPRFGCGRLVISKTAKVGD